MSCCGGESKGECAPPAATPSASSCCGPAPTPAAAPASGGCCGPTSGDSCCGGAPCEDATAPVGGGGGGGACCGGPAAPGADLSPDAIKSAVQKVYAGVAERATATPGIASSCCGGNACAPPAVGAVILGYSAEEATEGSEGGFDLGLGCGNPGAIAALKEGEVVLDLGSGAGFDCSLAAKRVGPTGKVIGVDMTPAMIAKARENATRRGLAQVEFRLGEIEALPVEANTVDCIISNCVINLSPSKDKVFAEAFRVLKPGGRLAVSDVVRTADMPAEVLHDLAALCGCISGAVTVAELTALIAGAGFAEINITPMDKSKDFIDTWLPGKNPGDYVLSASIQAVKP